VDQARPGRTATDKKGADKKGADKKGSDRKGAVPCPSVTIALTVVGLLTSRESAP
jgi:hypothetical protein